MIIHVLDRYEKVVGVLSNEAPFSCPFFDDLHTENIRMGTNSFTFSVPANHEMATKIEADGNIIFPNLDGEYQMFKIKDIEEVASAESYVKTVRTEHTAISDLLGYPVRPNSRVDYSLKDSIQFILKDTEYKMGQVDAVNGYEIKYDKHMTVLEALYTIAETFQVEIQFEVKFKNGKITDKLIHLKRKLGKVTNKLFTYSKDLQEVTRTENSEALVTALIGVGKGDDNGNVLTLANYSPLELPDGFYKKHEDDFIYSEDALQNYGKNGKHRFGIYFSEAEDGKTLAEETVKELKARSVPYLTWEMSVALLERVSGYESEKVRVGDTINAKDNTMNPPLMLEARVLELSRSYTNPENDSLILGDYKPIAISNYGDIKKIQEAILANEKKWSNAGVSIPEVEEVVEGKIQPIERDVNDVKNNVSILEDEFGNVKEELKDKEYAILRQSTKPTGTNYVVGQLWIDGNDYIYRWTGTEWRKLISISLSDIGAVGEQEYNKAISDIQKANQDATDKIQSLTQSVADKVDAEFVNGKLVYKADADNVYTKVESDEKLGDKADKSNTYTKQEVNDALNSYVTNTTFTTDMNGVITDLESHESRIKQNENKIEQTVSSTEYQDLIGKKNILPYMEIGVLEWATGKEHSGTDRLRSPYFEVESSNTYTASVNGKDIAVSWFEFDIDLSLLNVQQATRTTFTVGESTKYLRIIKQSDTNPNQKFQIEKGSKPTAYVPYISNDKESNRRISTVETAIIQTDEAIKLKANASEVYTKTEVDASIEDIEIGGTNLARNTQYGYNNYGNSKVTETESTPTNIVRVDVLGTTASGLEQSSVGRKMKLELGETYTLSFDFRGNLSGNLYYIYIMNKDTGNESVAVTPTKPKSDAEWTKVVSTFTKRYDSIDSWVMISTNNSEAGDWFEVRNIKVEKGNKATDWSPSPLDIESDIKEVESRVEKAESELIIQSDKIASKVESSVYTKKVSDLSNDISQKANASNVYTKNETDTRLSVKANNNTVIAIEERLSKAETDIIQTDKSISLKANASEVYTKTETDMAINDVEIGGRNLFVIKDASENKLFAWTSGNMGTETDSLASGFIAVKPNENIIANYWISQIMFYNKNKSFIGTYRNGQLYPPESTGAGASSFIIPSDVAIAYMRLSFREGFLSDKTVKGAKILVERGTKLTDYTIAPEDTEAVISGIESRITEAESELSVQSGQIQSRVTKTEMDSAIDDIELGVRNLLIGTKKMVDGMSNKVTYNGLTYGYYGYAWGFNFNVDLIKGQTYTISVPVYNSNSSSISNARLYAGHIGNMYKTISPLEATVVSHTFTAKQDEMNAVVRFLTANETYPDLAWYYPMLQKGDKYTDWQPAPEDTDREFTETSTRISNAESRIAQTEKDITSKVSQTTWDANIPSLTNRMKTAESDISQNATSITQRVKTTDFTGQTIASKIVQTPSAIDSIAKNINLTGLVSFNSFDSSLKNTINDKATTSYVNTQSSNAENNAKNYMDIQPITDGNGKVFNNVASHSTGTSGVTGCLVIETPITSTYMVKLHITGYNYEGIQSDIDLNLSFYAYTGDSFHQYSYSNVGNYPLTRVRLGRLNGKTVIILGLTSSSWSYPKIVVEKAIISHSNPPDTYKNGWNIKFTKDLSPYYNVITVNNGKDIQSDLTETKGLTDNWKYGNTTYIDGGNIYTNSVTANQINVTSLSSLSANLGTVTAGVIKGVSIEGGSIKSNTTIDVTTDLTVGDKIFVGGSGEANRGIYFGKPGDRTVGMQRIANLSYLDLSAERIQLSGDNLVQIGSLKVSTGGTVYPSTVELLGDTHVYGGWLYTDNVIDVGKDIRFNSGGGRLVFESERTYVQTNGDEVRATKYMSGTLVPMRASSHPTGSSILFKDNIEEFSLEDAHYLLDNADVCKYHIISNIENGIYDKPKIGMISEMVPALLRDENGVDTYSIVSTLWKIVKHQKEEIKSMKSEIETIYGLL